MAYAIFQLESAGPRGPCWSLPHIWKLLDGTLEKAFLEEGKAFLRKTQLACTFCFTSHFLPEMFEVLAPIIGP